ncbi:hypothetical protein B0J13DRAFT_158888 [Dactylonectria estremocensis]|uniref:C2H2-type domain-containing protein n=1 Tax=Dactylonectria estremocensis TaxID=1079267 RepID=A0A9P9DMF3_9HYPO|nr:hypothetical protein B0J13DRAFT_158888 [Dactylonectria estremocensis]
MLSISDDSKDKPATPRRPSEELASIITSVSQQLVSEFRSLEATAATNVCSFNLSESTVPSDAPAHGGSPRYTSGGLRPTNDTPGPVPSGGSKPRKRGRDDGDGDGEKSDKNGNDPNQPPLKKSKTEACKAGPKMLACPFWKNDPKKFKQCFHLKLTEIKRVKQHLIRKHTPEHYCNRCLVVFPSEEGLETHLTSQICARGITKLEGISYEQRKKLQCKSNRDSSESERWFAIWTIIFPNEPRPSSPYIPTGASEDLSRFLEFAQRRAASILFQRLRVSGIISVSDEEMSLSEQEILRQGFNDVYEQWLPTFPSLTGSATTSTSTSRRPRPMQHETPGSLPDSAVVLGGQTQPSELQFASSSTQEERLGMQRPDAGAEVLQNATAQHNLLSFIDPMAGNTSPEFSESLSAPAMDDEVNDTDGFGDLFTHTWDGGSDWITASLWNAG